MMISGTVNHIKFKRLMRELRLTEWECVGILESLWMLTGKSHICGDIGRSENIDIAIGIGWVGDENSLINALVKTGWLDECAECRLVVHDWSHHCPNHIKGNVAKYNKNFKIAVPRELPANSQGSELPIELASLGVPSEPPTKPSQFNSIQTNPIQVLLSLPAEAVAMTEILASHVFDLNPKSTSLCRKKIDRTVNAWADEFRKLNSIDGHGWEDIEKVLRWVIEDSFWRTNILSGAKFRKQFDAIFPKAIGPTSSSNSLSIKEISEYEF